MARLSRHDNDININQATKERPSPTACARRPLVIDSTPAYSLMKRSVLFPIVKKYIPDDRGKN